MNTTKFNKYFKKIKSFGGLVENLENLSLIEKDLLKDYIKNLYESIDDCEDNAKQIKKTKKNKKNNIIEKQSKVIKETVESTKVEVEIETPAKERLIEKKEYKFDDSTPVVTVTEEIKEVIPKISQDLLGLFESSDSSELSQKLSQTSITNLTQSFSINERIFTVKELFGGDKNMFEKAIEDLDNLNSLEEAKNYLITNVVNDFGWDEPKMIKKVNEFIKKVKRRYL